MSNKYETELSFEMLKKEGGTCLHYSKLYFNWFREFGVKNLEYVDIKSENTYHRYLRVWNGEGYCILDQSSVHCFMYKPKK